MDLGLDVKFYENFQMFFLYLRISFIKNDYSIERFISGSS